uniref:Synaptopodin 2b n=1 Tax=Tetraodon nigroviridis TaxID=99883 RepID=H3BYA8_TETNG
VDSSEEGGSHEAPPASLFFGMSDEGAEQAETWNCESDTDLCRALRQRPRNTCISHNESQSERQAKENKSKCKKIARLLTDAPNPQNKGALLFNKRRQRVEKYTLVSYGTGDDGHGSQDQVEEDVEEIRSAGYDFVETTDSELEEEYWAHQRQQNSNWGSLRDMEALPDTKGKGVLMFAKCRKRVDEVVSAQEQLRSKERCEGKFITRDMYDAQRAYYPAESVDGNTGQPGEYQEPLHQVNHLSSNMSRALVSNRTAKPFPGFQDCGAAAVVSGVAVPSPKKHDLKFKVPVLTSTNPQVWSPTGDVIASRDERISVPAIRTGILPESKRRLGAKPSSAMGQGKQSPGERRPLMDAEEDCFSLGAEACNFMQPRRVKLKNPPPVAPKPAMNAPVRRSPLSEPYAPARSPASQPCSTSGRAHSQQHLHQRDWEPARPGASGPGGAPRSQPPPQSAVSMPVCRPASSPPAPPPPSKSRGAVSDGGFHQTGGAFAQNQSCSEKFLFHAERVRENKPRSPSPTSSLPKGWRYSSNVRAPPPVAYNPLLAPFYPPSAARQPPSTSPQIKPKSKEKAPKQLNTLDIMKHQPYQLSRSLFRYEASAEAKTAKPGPVSKFETTKQNELEAPATPAASSGPQNLPAHQTVRAEKLLADANANAAAARPVGPQRGRSIQPASKASQRSPAGRSIASAFSPASLIARGARQMAPRPKFCATKPAVTGPQWRPVALLR